MHLRAGWRWSCVSQNATPRSSEIGQLSGRAAGDPSAYAAFYLFTDEPGVLAGSPVVTVDGFVFGPVVTAPYFAEQGRTHPLFTRRAANTLGPGLQNCRVDDPREGTEETRTAVNNVVTTSPSCGAETQSLHSVK